MIAGTQGQDEVIEPQKRTFGKKPLLAIGICLALMALIWPSLAQWYSGIPTIEKQKQLIASVTRGDLIRDVAVNGKLVAANAPQLYSSESGVVNLLVKPGDNVTAGDIVAQVESPELAAEIRQQTARLTQLQTDAQRGELADKEAQLELEGVLDRALVALNAAKREKTRADLSYDKQVISELEWAQVQDAQQEAELLYKHAAKKVEIAKQRLSFEQQNRDNAVNSQKLVLEELQRRNQALSIQAPVDGVVGNWLIAQKDRVAKSTPLMTIVDLTDYEAELSVPEFYADDLGLGLIVNMQLAGKQIEGEIISISPEIKGNQVQVKAKLNDTQQLKLRQNQLFNARIEFESKSNVLMVKRGSFLQTDLGKTAFRLTDSQTATKQTITTGLSSVDYVEIISGLEQGDEIIISSYEEFEQHSAVKLSQ